MYRDLKNWLKSLKEEHFNVGDGGSVINVAEIRNYL